MRTLSLVIFCVFQLAAVTDAQTSRKSVSGAEVTGTFEMKFPKKFRGSANEIKIAALGGGKLRVAMDLLFPYTLAGGELTAHLGSLEEEFAIEGDTATFTGGDGDECKITIKFVHPGIIKVTQNGSDAACGFGHNVTANGTYTKVSSKKPVFVER